MTNGNQYAKWIVWIAAIVFAAGGFAFAIKRNVTDNGEMAARQEHLTTRVTEVEKAVVEFKFIREDIAEIKERLRP